MAEWIYEVQPNREVVSVIRNGKLVNQVRVAELGDEALTPAQQNELLRDGRLCVDGD